jgi:hypothetical protein
MHRACPSQSRRCNTGHTAASSCPARAPCSNLVDGRICLDVVCAGPRQPQLDSFAIHTAARNSSTAGMQSGQGIMGAAARPRWQAGCGRAVTSDVGEKGRRRQTPHLIMPAVTLFCRCSGLPSATTHSPTRKLAERPANKRMRKRACQLGTHGLAALCGASPFPSPFLSAPLYHPVQQSHPTLPYHHSLAANPLTQLDSGQRAVCLHLEYCQVTDGVVID